MQIKIGRFRGGFCVYWREAGRRRRYQLNARTRAEAEAEALEVFRKETYKSRPESATVAQLWALYIEDLGDRPTATTMGHTGKAVLPHFGAFKPEDIDKPLCTDYSKARLAKHKSVGTVWTELGHLQSALNFAVKTRLIEKAPKIWRPVKPESDKRIIDRGEARALIDAAHDPHIRLALILLFGTAARIGAILDLEWDRVDFDRNSINLRIPESHTRKGRAIVPMNGMVRAALATARDSALSDFVIEYAGQPVKSIRTGFTNAIRRSGIGHTRIHDIRHTAAVTMLHEGKPLEMVAQMLGHSNISVTYQTYGRYLPGHMQEAADVLDFVKVRKA